MKLGVKYNSFKSSVELTEGLKLELSNVIDASLRKYIFELPSNLLLDDLLKRVETNKKGLYESIELWPNAPRIESSIAIVFILNSAFRSLNDWRYINASLKLLDVLSGESFEHIPKRYYPILEEECRFVEQLELAL